MIKDWQPESEFLRAIDARQEAAIEARAVRRVLTNLLVRRCGPLTVAIHSAQPLNRGVGRSLCWAAKDLSRGPIFGLRGAGERTTEAQRTQRRDTEGLVA